MNGRRVLIAATLGEVTLLVAVLAGYLVAIAARLRSVSKTLARVTFGVRAIETQTAPVGPRLREINAALEQVAAALQDLAGERPEARGDTTAGGTDGTGTIEASGDVPPPTR